MLTRTNQLMTVADVSAELSLGVSTIWRRVKEGTFPSPIKTGGATRFFRSDIEAHIQSLRPGSPGDADKKVGGGQ